METSTYGDYYLQNSDILPNVSKKRGVSSNNNHKNLLFATWKNIPNVVLARQESNDTAGFNLGTTNNYVCIFCNTVWSR